MGLGWGVGDPPPILRVGNPFLRVREGFDGLDVLCSQYIKRGSILYTDGARVYEQISKNLGFSHDYVDHQENEFAKDANIQGKKRRVHTNSIDGRWGILKNWIRNRGGVNSEHLFQNLKEFQWRQNLQQRDPFITLCETDIFRFDKVHSSHFSP